MAILFPRGRKASGIQSIPVYIGLFVLLLSLPAALLLARQRQEYRKQAAERTFTAIPNAPIERGRIIVRYQPKTELKTTSDVNQHKDRFEVNQITSSSNVSTTTLQAVGTRKIERVFKSAKLPQERNAVERLLGVFGVARKVDPMANYVVLDVPSNADVTKTINLLLKDPAVASAEPVYLFQTFATPNDTLYSQQWSMPKIHAPEAWDSTTGSNNITVAVIDTGVDLGHPDLQANLVAGGNMVNPTQTAQDILGHGTHVAGIVGAVGNNATGVAGINWRVKIMPVQVFKFLPGQTLPSAPDDALAAGIRFAADNGAKVINLSLGSNTGAAPQIVSDAVNYAANKGVILVAAAGNFHSDVANVYPANLLQVIAISNTTQQDTLFNDPQIGSNYGSKIVVGAPGTNILSTSWTGSLFQGCQNNQYCVLTGTSMASPLAAGAVALLLATNPNLNRDTVAAILKNSADNTGTADPAGFPVLRLNMKKALDMASSGTSPSPLLSPSASPNGSPTPTPVGNVDKIRGIARKISQACPAAAPVAIVKDLNAANAAQGHNYIGIVDGYGGIPFQAIGDVFIYVKVDCNVDLQAQAGTAITSVRTPKPLPKPTGKNNRGPAIVAFNPQAAMTLHAGWNKVTLTGNEVAATIPQTAPQVPNDSKRKQGLQRLLFGD